MNVKCLWSPWRQGTKIITYSVFSQLKTFPFVIRIKTKLFYVIRYICLLVKKPLLEQVTRSKAFCSFRFLWSTFPSETSFFCFLSEFILLLKRTAWIFIKCPYSVIESLYLTYVHLQSRTIYANVVFNCSTLKATGGISKYVWLLLWSIYTFTVKNFI
jgi:hypothetical protein